MNVKRADVVILYAYFYYVNIDWIPDTGNK